MFAQYYSNVTTESLMFEITMDHDYSEGTDIHFHLAWAGTDGNAGNVDWHLEYIWLDDGDATDGNTSDIQLVVANPGLFRTETDFTTISGSGKTIGSTVHGNLHRDTGASDTYGSDAAAFTLGLHYQVDGIGSATEDTKD